MTKGEIFSGLSVDTMQKVKEFYSPMYGQEVKRDV